ncbi:MAG: hypothetical protein IJA34_02560 [Lachnospiraceae bacterium]|nr:hypothetical protein [Lachnospiraceae bacterium]
MGDSRRIYTQSEKDELVKLYEKSLEDLISSTKNMYEDISKLAIKVDYADLCNIVNGVANAFNDELKKMLIKNFDEWQQSEADIISITRKKEKDPILTDEAQKMEKKMQDSMNTILRERLETIPIKGTDADITPETEKRIVEMVKKTMNELEVLQEKYIKRVKRRSEKNAIYTDILPLVEGAYIMYISGLKQTLKQFKIFEEELAADLKKDTQIKRETRKTLSVSAGNAINLDLKKCDPFENI